jgi:tRNA A-37 threonylcarbamoyl transferase component Bud32
VSEKQSAAARNRSVRGKPLGRYTLVEHLATGGMAEIFLARLEADGFAKELVLKVLQERYADNPQVVAMFLEEARLGAQLRHPSIVDVFEIGEADGVRFIAMEYLEGRTLNEVVTRGLEVGLPLPRTHAAYIAAQVADGLAYLTGGLLGRGLPLEVVHRDISPPNLIVGYAGQTTIIDFGIARHGDTGSDEAGLKPGKVSYMSPEQVRGEPLDGRSDLFSLGTILYEITLGRRLWRGPPPVVMQRIADEVPAPPTYIDRNYPALLERVVMRALEKRPEDRYPTAADMVADLDRYLGQTDDRIQNRHVARYLQSLWAEDVVVSAGGVRQARAFDEDEDPGGEHERLDFDRAARVRDNAGADLAHALRDAHPIDLALDAARAPQQPAATQPGQARTTPTRSDVVRTPDAPAAAGLAFATSGLPSLPGRGTDPASVVRTAAIPAAAPSAKSVTWVLLAVGLLVVLGGLFFVWKGP